MAKDPRNDLLKGAALLKDGVMKISSAIPYIRDEQCRMFLAAQVTRIACLYDCITSINALFHKDKQGDLWLDEPYKTESDSTIDGSKPLSKDKR